jgi:peptide/nickel transport system substrate-binding protein
MSQPAAAGLTRRDLLTLGGAALGTAVAGAFTRPTAAEAQAPKRGGVFRLPIGNPPMFDHQLTVSWPTQIALSFTHSRLLKVKAGPSVAPGTFPLEGDLAESWSQPNETTYVFKLHRGVRWHPKPPVNGRELTAEDVKYTYERFLTVTGNPNRAQLEEVDRIDALDRYTVRFTLKAPYAWLLDALATPSMFIVAREVVEQFGDLKRSDACIGTGPWMLDRHDSGSRLTWVRHPNYFVPGLPYADVVDGFVHPDPASRLAAWLAGRYDFAPEYLMVVRRADLDVVKERKPGLQTAEFLWPVGSLAVPKLGQEPFKDVRVRHAMMVANNWKEILESNAIAEGQGVPNPAVPAALREWAIPIAELPPDGRKLYEHDPAAAKRLLALAGYPNGFRVPLETSGGFGPDFLDAVQVVQKNWKAVGIEVDLKLKETGAFLASALYGRFDKLMMMNRGSVVYPDPYLVHQYVPGQPLNAAGVDDAKLTEMIRLQRRTFDVAKRRDILYDIQRHLSEKAYYLLVGPSSRVVSAWEPYVKNFAPNLGNDYGGRLMAAWLHR